MPIVKIHNTKYSHFYHTPLKWNRGTMEKKGKFGSWPSTPGMVPQNQPNQTAYLILFLLLFIFQDFTMSQAGFELMTYLLQLPTCWDL